jgi:branched-chain amino acid transport system ATP-binding protein
MAAMTEGLTAGGLSKRFGGVAAVADVSLELRCGRVLAVIGPNGAGKSTLINLLSGAIRADAGTVHLNGTDITALPDWRRARAGIGRSFQHTNLFPAMTVLENARLAAQSTVHGARLFGEAASNRETLDRAHEALEKVGLGGVATLRTNMLSHGQHRLLEIALVLATGPGVLLLDEPLAGLGPEETAPVAGLLRDLAANHAMLLVEHDMDVVFAIAHEVMVMVDGRVLESGTPDSVRGSAAVRDAYLGHRA